MKTHLLRFVVLLGIGIFAISMSMPVEHDGYHIGSKAADFSLKNIDGNMVSLADYEEAKGFIVVFTCNHCPFAVMYEDRLNDLHDKYASQGYPLIAINPNDPAVAPDDSFDGMKLRAKEKNFEFPYLFDEGQKVYPLFGATKTPHVFILDKDRVVQYIGAIDDSPRDPSAVENKYVEDAIKAMANNLEINPATTKAIGCSIKTTKNGGKKGKKRKHPIMKANN